MSIRRGKLPKDGDWIKTDEAAGILSRATGREITAAKFRRWCATNDYHVRDYDVWQPGREYLIDKRSMLRSMERSAERTMRVIEEERARGKPS